MIASPQRMLVVCRGNICRSPMAEGALRFLARRTGAPLHVDSAGSAPTLEGAPPDPRAMIAAARRGVDITGGAARAVTAADFNRYDLLLAVDRRTYADLRLMAPLAPTARLGLFMEAVPGPLVDVPDPFFDDQDMFDRVYDIVATGAAALLDGLPMPALR